MRCEVRHFRPEEFECRCGCGLGGVSEVLVLWLEVLRRAWGGAVVVTSGRRCAARNKAVGGADHSRHLIGCAADIRPARGDFGEFAALVRRMTEGLSGWEVLIYADRGFVHVGVPRGEAERLWRGGSVKF